MQFIATIISFIGLWILAITLQKFIKILSLLKTKYILPRKHFITLVKLVELFTIYPILFHQFFLQYRVDLQLIVLILVTIIIIMAIELALVVLIELMLQIV